MSTEEATYPMTTPAAQPGWEGDGVWISPPTSVPLDAGTVQTMLPVDRSPSSDPPASIPVPSDEQAPGVAFAHGNLAFGEPARLRPLPIMLAPTPKRLLEHVPDTALDALDINDASVRAVSVRGHLHRYLGEVRQDSYAIGAVEGCLVLAVADGVGSCPSSELGSASAARVAVGSSHLVSTLRDVTDQQSEVDLVEIVRHLTDIAAERHLDPGMLATTLLVAVVDLRVPPDGHVPVTILERGDSHAWRSDGGGWTRSGAPVESEEDPLATSVEPLPQYQVGRVWRLHLSPGETLLLATDGVGDLLRRDGTDAPASPEYASALAELWRDAAPAPADLLRVVDATVRSYDDDRTLVGIKISDPPR